MRQRRQEQHVEPDQRPHDHARRGAARRAPAPDQPAHEGRQDLRQRSEGEQADGGQRCAAGEPGVEIAQRQHEQDRGAADEQHIRADLAGRLLFAALTQQHGHDEIVRDRDRQRDAVDHHHARGRRKPADHGQKRDGVRADAQRQRQHGEIAIDRTVGKQRQTGDRQRQHEQIDQDEIERKQPRRGFERVEIGVLDHRDMKLARQQQDGARREQRDDQPVADVRRRADDGGYARRTRELRDVAEPAEDAPDDEGANA